MKKTIAILFWMIAFLLFGGCVFAVIGTPLLYLVHKNPQMSDWIILSVVMTIGLILGIGFPVLALKLGIRGRLPGTRTE